MPIEDDDQMGPKHVQVKLTPEEYKALKSQAHKAEMALQPFVRRLIVQRVAELERLTPIAIKPIRKGDGR